MNKIEELKFKINLLSHDLITEEDKHNRELIRKWIEQLEIRIKQIERGE